MNINQKGFINILVIIGLVILAGVAGYFIVNRQSHLPVSQIIKGHSASGKSIKVTLVHDKSTAHALNDNFVITNNTHIAISLYYAPYADGPSENILVQDFSGIEKLPFLFSITGALDKTFKNPKGYYLSTKVFKHSGSEVVIGDLVSEISTPVSPNDSNIEIKVFGMEDCGASYAGGFCTTKK